METTNSLFAKRRRPSDLILTGLIYLCAAFAIFLVVGIVVYVFVRGIGQVNWDFLTTVRSARRGTFGIAGNLLNTLYVIIITLLIATPLGVGAAIYLNEYAKPGRLVRMNRYTYRNIVRHSFYYFRPVRHGVLRNDPASGLLDLDRLSDADASDPSADHKKHTGSAPDGS